MPAPVSSNSLTSTLSGTRARTNRYPPSATSSGTLVRYGASSRPRHSADEKVGRDAEQVAECSNLLHGQATLPCEEFGDARFPAHRLIQICACHSPLIEH